MKTAGKVTHTRVTLNDLREQVRAFEATHPGYDRSNYTALFRDEDGDLSETDEFFRVSRMYRRLERAERAM